MILASFLPGLSSEGRKNKNTAAGWRPAEQKILKIAHVGSGHGLVSSLYLGKLYLLDTFKVELFSI